MGASPSTGGPDREGVPTGSSPTRDEWIAGGARSLRSSLGIPTTSKHACSGPASAFERDMHLSLARSRAAVLAAMPLLAVACTSTEDSASAESAVVAGTPAPPTCRPEAVFGDFGDGAGGTPIKPPSWGPVDLSGGLTMTRAKEIFCDGTDFETVGDSTCRGWGPDNALVACASRATDKVDFIQWNRGSKAWASFSSRVGGRYGEHTYHLNVDGWISRDGSPWAFDFSPAMANELNDAMNATFAPNEPEDADCVASQRCVARRDDYGAVFGSRITHLYFFSFASQIVPQGTALAELYTFTAPIGVLPTAEPTGRR